jgi:hypothetical protein
MQVVVVEAVNLVVGLEAQVAVVLELELQMQLQLLELQILEEVVAAERGNGTPGAGGSGIVIIRYGNSYPDAFTTGSPSYTNTGGFKIYRFTGTGSIIF